MGYPCAHGDDDFAVHCEREADAPAERVEATAWDGDWYLRTSFSRRARRPDLVHGLGQWVLRLVLESLLGLGPRGNQLRLRPLLPEDWMGFEMRYRYGTASYEMACRAVDDGAAETTTLDGIAVRGGWNTLLDDGKRHAVSFDVRPRGSSRLHDAPVQTGGTCRSA